MTDKALATDSLIREMNHKLQVEVTRRIDNDIDMLTQGLISTREFLENMSKLAKLI